MLSASVFIDPVLCFSQGVPIGFISSPENAAELISMRWQIDSLTASLRAHHGILATQLPCSGR
jgi:hypothetical protein